MANPDKKKAQDKGVKRWTLALFLCGGELRANHASVLVNFLFLIAMKAGPAMM